MNGDDAHSPSSAADDPAFLQRLARYLDEGLPPAELAQLEGELAADPRKADTFALVCLGEALAHEEYRSGGAGDADDGADLVATEPRERMHDAAVMPALHEEPHAQPPPGGPAWPGRGHASGPTPRHWWLGGSIAAAFLLGAALALLTYRHSGSGASPGRQARRGGATSRVTIPVPEVVATVVGVAGGGVDFTVGSPLAAEQPVSVRNGACVQMRFNDGADVVVEGPAELVAVAGGAVSLKAGRVAVKMGEGRFGFVVRTPVAAVTDLGTEFAVSAAAGSGATDVHVFKGAVTVGATGDVSHAADEVAAGDRARVDAGGHVDMMPGGANAQAFVRDIRNTPVALDLADLISRGDGTMGLRGGVIDQTNGDTGSVPTMEPSGALRSDGKYHRTPTLPTVDGCFMPGATAGGADQVDSAGHRFRFPVTEPLGTVRICAGGVIPKLKSGDEIVPRLGGVDYSAPGHSYLFLHPSVGLTFDLDAVRRLHPNARIERFRCAVGRSIGQRSAETADAFVLVDGQERFSRRQFLAREGPFTVDVVIRPGDRFLTLATTAGGGKVVGKQILFGDPLLTLVPGR